MKKKLFITAILHHPNWGEDTQLLYGPAPLLSADFDSAKIDALRVSNIPSNIPSDQLEVIVRPF